MDLLALYTSLKDALVILECRFGLGDVPLLYLLSVSDAF